MGKNKNKNKIVVVGAGNVGEAIAYTLMLRKQASDIVLVDLNEDRAKGSALDIAHATAFFRQIKVRKGGYEECEDAAIIVITAGMARKPGQTRLDLAKSNRSFESGRYFYLCCMPGIRPPVRTGDRYRHNAGYRTLPLSDQRRAGGGCL